ncbi:MAG: terminase [Gemmataceae bacterium]
MSAACRAARIGRRRVYTCYHAQPKFRRAWEAAIEEATDALEAEARRRAVDGVPTPVFHAGVQVGTVTRYSDALLARLLQAYRPGRFGDRRRDEAVGSVVVQVATAPSAGELAITAADIEAARRLLGQHQRAAHCR